MSLELLNNSGIEFIGDKTCLENENKTLIVLGIARGGTSLIAGALDNLGIFGGERSVKPVFEDVKLAEAFENKNFNEAYEIIQSYNSKNNIWYFKRPASIEYFDKLNKSCINPIYLIVFKDIFSVSNRNSISMKTDLVKGINKAYEDYGKLLKIMSKEDINAFLFSYEKILQNKDTFINTLVNIIGKNISAENIESALRFIEPNPKEYLNASRITRGIGNIGTINSEIVMGWARHLHNETPVFVELYINDILTKEILANDFRQHLVDLGKHSTGNCGFMFNLKDILIKEGDIISVKVKDDVIYLNGSNFVYTNKK